MLFWEATICSLVKAHLAADPLVALEAPLARSVAAVSNFPVTLAGWRSANYTTPFPDEDYPELQSRLRGDEIQLHGPGYD